MKDLVLSLVIRPLASVLRLFRPVALPFSRLYCLLLLEMSLPGLKNIVQCDGRVSVRGTGKVSIGKRCRLGRDMEFETSDEGEICLGDDIRINRGCTMVSYARIRIGDYAIIGEYVSIRDANHGTDPGEPMRYQRHESSPITIGRDVWIGRGTCILPGVTIGEGSVIGANSVVTDDIPSFSIAAGVPAKVIRQRRKHP